jgi:hypothetical protein
MNNGVTVYVELVTITGEISERYCILVHARVHMAERTSGACFSKRRVRWHVTSWLVRSGQVTSGTKSCCTKSVAVLARTTSLAKSSSLKQGEVKWLLLMTSLFCRRPYRRRAFFFNDFQKILTKQTNCEKWKESDRTCRVTTWALLSRHLTVYFAREKQSQRGMLVRNYERAHRCCQTGDRGRGWVRNLTCK